MIDYCGTSLHALPRSSEICRCKRSPQTGSGRHTLRRGEPFDATQQLAFCTCARVELLCSEYTDPRASRSAACRNARSAPFCRVPKGGFMMTTSALHRLCDKA